jgi:hypothetical protein
MNVSYKKPPVIKPAKEIREGYFIYTARATEQRPIISLLNDIGIYGRDVVAPIFRPIQQEIDCGDDNIICFKSKAEAKAISRLINEHPFKNNKVVCLVGLRIYDKDVRKYFPVYLNFKNKTFFKSLMWFTDNVIRIFKPVKR